MFDKIVRRLKTIYSSSPGVQKLTKKISGSGLYFWFTKTRVNTQKEKDKTGPFNLVIETSNFCNAQCLMCPYKIMRREKKIINEETFQKIIERVKRENLPLNKVIFSGMGEPLIDHKIISRIQTFKDMNAYVKLYTNAFLMTEKIAQQLIDLGLDEINISFNGVTVEQYQKIMGLDFETTKGNIKRLIKIKKEIGSRLPIIRISSIVVKENEKDIKKYIDYWRDKVDSVTVSMPHEWGGTIKISSKFKFQSLKLIYPCRSLWHTFVLDSGGNFVICCRDYESKYVLGNIHTHSFKNVQQNSVLKEFRQKHLQYLKDNLPLICRSCNFPFQDGIEWYLSRSID